MATSIRHGLLSGATSSWAESSISPASATAPSTNTSSPSPPTTTPTAHKLSPANTSSPPTNPQSAGTSRDLKNGEPAFPGRLARSLDTGSTCWQGYNPSHELG